MELVVKSMNDHGASAVANADDAHGVATKPVTVEEVLTIVEELSRLH